MGKSEIMKIYDEYKVVQGGTYNGHQLGLAAIKATFQILLGMYEDSYSLFEKRCRIMRDLLIASGEKAEIPIVVQGE